MAVPGVHRRTKGVELGLRKQERCAVRDDNDRDVFPAPGGFALWACAVVGVTEDAGIPEESARHAGLVQVAGSPVQPRPCGGPLVRVEGDPPRAVSGRDGVTARVVGHGNADRRRDALVRTAEAKRLVVASREAVVVVGGRGAERVTGSWGARRRRRRHRWSGAAHYMQGRRPRDEEGAMELEEARVH